MARSYASPSEDGSLIGAIFGTGTNGAYVEKIENIPKLKHVKGLKSMVINMEWAAFDNKVLSLYVMLTTAQCDAKYSLRSSRRLKQYQPRLPNV
jgi:hexokinase